MTVMLCTLILSLHVVYSLKQPTCIHAFTAFAPQLTRATTLL